MSMEASNLEYLQIKKRDAKRQKAFPSAHLAKNVSMITFLGETITFSSWDPHDLIIWHFSTSAHAKDCLLTKKLSNHIGWSKISVGA